MAQTEDEAAKLMTFRLDPILKQYLTELKWIEKKSEAQVLRDLILDLAEKRGLV